MFMETQQGVFFSVAVAFAVTSVVQAPGYLERWVALAALLLAGLTSGVCLVCVLVHRKCSASSSSSRAKGIVVSVLLGVSVLAADLSARGLHLTAWPLLVLLIDLLVVLRVDKLYTFGYLCVVLLWMVLMSLETVLRFGLFDLPGLAPQLGESGRAAHFRGISSCDTPPCRGEVRLEAAQLAMGVSVLLANFIAARGLAAEHEVEQAAMQHTIHTIQDIAHLLSLYDVDGVAAILADPNTPLPMALRTSLQKMEKHLRTYRTHLPASLFEEAETAEQDLSLVPPPGLESGVATIVFTDIRSSTTIWETAPDAMCLSLPLHNVIIRNAICAFSGYEVKTIGDAFMIAFEQASDAVHFGIRVQEELRDAPWPPSLFDSPICAEQGHLWGGLTVRIGINSGPVALEQSSLTGRTDYFGHTVNVASRLESTCTPGAVAVPSALFLSECRSCPAVFEEAGVRMRGVSEAVRVCSVWPISLAGRKNHGFVEPNIADTASLKTGPSRAPSEDTVATFNPLFNPQASQRNTGLYGTIGVVDLLEGDSRILALRTLGNELSHLTYLLERAEGTVVSLLGNCACVGWNLVRVNPTHLEHAVLFAQQISGTSLGAGFVSGPMQHGEVRAQKQRYVTVIGGAVGRCWTLCEEAAGEGGGVCLCEPHGGVMPAAVSDALTPDERPGVYRVVPSSDKEKGTPKDCIDDFSYGEMPLLCYSPLEAGSLQPSSRRQTRFSISSSSPSSLSPSSRDSHSKSDTVSSMSNMTRKRRAEKEKDFP